MNILAELLRTKEFVLFEKFLPVLNYIESDKVLLQLAKLYYDHGLGQMAV
jgi:hypothetical protein